MSAISFNRSFGLAIAITTLLACGGAAESGDATGGATGTLKGAGGSTGNGGDSSIGGLCCNSRPTCRVGDTELSNAETCPTGSTCYMQPAVCCSPAILCASGVGGSSQGGASTGGASTGGTSTGGLGNVGGNSGLGGWAWDTPSEPVGGACSAPACAAGYSHGNSGCPLTTPNPCYTADECGGGMTCLKTSVVCDRAAEYNRRYQYADTTACQTANITCPSNTTVFKNACGCGCEQSATCPQWVDCMPGGTLSPMCSDSTNCPFTLRAL